MKIRILLGVICSICGFAAAAIIILSFPSLGNLEHRRPDLKLKLEKDKAGRIFECYSYYVTNAGKEMKHGSYFLNTAGEFSVDQTAILYIDGRYGDGANYSVNYGKAAGVKAAEGQAASR